ncbi:MAG: rubredoxin [Bacteroidales bacterium]|nr:rubredoxin [Bacteroidales bacterium]
MIFIGEVVNAVKLNSGTPLTYKYYREVRKGKAPKNAPTYVDPESLRQYTDAVSFSKHKCKVCGYLYDPVKGDKGTGIHPGTAFEDLPATWRCPVCGAAQDDFTLVVN